MSIATPEGFLPGLCLALYDLPTFCVVLISILTNLEGGEKKKRKEEKKEGNDR
jgi:hypothetical protein